MSQILNLRTPSEEAFNHGRELEKLEDKISRLSLNISLGCMSTSELKELKEAINTAYERYIVLANEYHVNNDEIIRVNERYKSAMNYSLEIKKDDSSVVVDAYMD